MAYKLGFLLSLIFIVQLFVLAGDILSIQIIYTNLDAVSVTVGQSISKNGAISDDVIRLVENEAQAQIEPVGDTTPMFGSLFEYRIYRDYEPYIIPKDHLEISIVRSVMIGYIG